MWVRPAEHRVVGKGLAEARKRANVTQQGLAKKLGKPQSFVSSYERGQRRIDLLEFLRITEALRCDPQAVLADVMQARSRRGK